MPQVHSCWSWHRYWSLVLDSFCCLFWWYSYLYSILWRSWRTFKVSDAILGAEKFYINLKKCTFMSLSVIFLGFVVSSKGVQIDLKKIKAIVDQRILTNIYEVRSFHGMATFYWWFFEISALLCRRLLYAWNLGHLFGSRQPTRHLKKFYPRWWTLLF